MLFLWSTCHTQNTVPFKGVLALWSEVVDVGFEVEFEDVVFMDVLRLWWNGDGVTKQREAGQRVVILWADEPEGQEIISFNILFNNILLLDQFPISDQYLLQLG